MIKTYGANGGPFTKRISYLLDEAGKIVKVYDHVKPDEHAAEVLADVKK